MSLGRPPSTIKRLDVKIRILPDLIGILDLLCVDPLTSRIKYGERTRHVEIALTEYLAKHYPQISKKGLDDLDKTTHHM